jgi:hypothetical protein
MRLQGKWLKHTVDLEMPLAWAACRTLECVPPRGLRDSVRFSKLAICSSPMVRGGPGRSSS